MFVCRSRALFLAAGLALLAASAASAQRAALAPGLGATRISCGEVIRGRIRCPGEVDAFRFLASAGDVVDVALVGTYPGGYQIAEVFAPSGRRIASFSSDDLRALALGESGQYGIRVRAWDRVFTGPYSVGLSCRSPLQPGVPSLTCGSVVQGEISLPAEVDYVAFDGQAGDVVEVTLSGTLPGGYQTAAVFAPSGSLVASFSSDVLQEMTLAETGRHVVRVTAWDLVFTGPYWVGLSCRVPLGPVAGNLACGTLLYGEIASPAEVDYVSFDGVAGDVVEVTLLGTYPDDYQTAAVFAPSGGLLAAFSADALQEVTLTETGRHAVRVASWDYAFTGQYVVGLSCRSPLGPVVANLTCGTSVGSEISVPGEVDYFTFDGQAGEIVELSLVGTLPDGYQVAAVFAPSGALIATLVSDVVQEIPLSETGQHAVRVTSWDLVFTGVYQVGLACP